jgi:hypothetical protein
VRGGVANDGGREIGPRMSWIKGGTYHSDSSQEV